MDNTLLTRYVAISMSEFVERFKDIITHTRGKRIGYIFISGEVSYDLVHELARNMQGYSIQVPKKPTYLATTEDILKVINFLSPSVNFLCDCLENITTNPINNETLR